jgi:hypothetical protein
LASRVISSVSSVTAALSVCVMLMWFPFSELLE